MSRLLIRQNNRICTCTCCNLQCNPFRQFISMTFATYSFGCTKELVQPRNIHLPRHLGIQLQCHDADFLLCCLSILFAYLCALVSLLRMILSSRSLEYLSRSIWGFELSLQIEPMDLIQPAPIGLVQCRSCNER